MSRKSLLIIVIITILLLIIFGFFIYQLHLELNENKIDDSFRDSTQVQITDPSFGGLVNIKVEYPKWIQNHPTQHRTLDFVNNYKEEILAFAIEDYNLGNNNFPYSIYADFEQIKVSEYDGIYIRAYTIPETKEVHLTSTFRNGEQISLKEYLDGINLHKDIFLNRINNKLKEGESPTLDNIKEIKHWNIVPSIDGFPQIRLINLDNIDEKYIYE